MIATLAECPGKTNTRSVTSLLSAGWLSEFDLLALLVGLLALLGLLDVLGMLELLGLLVVLKFYLTCLIC